MVGPISPLRLKSTVTFLDIIAASSRVSPASSARLYTEKRVTFSNTELKSSMPPMIFFRPSCVA